MRQTKKSRSKRGRRAFLKALPSAGAAARWTADKLGGALVGWLLNEACRVVARPEPARVPRHYVLKVETMHVGVTFNEVLLTHLIKADGTIASTIVST
jgi:hypothetical protein